jgi:hypothetical protein
MITNLHPELQSSNGEPIEWMSSIVSNKSAFWRSAQHGIRLLLPISGVFIQAFPNFWHGLGASFLIL